MAVGARGEGRLDGIGNPRAVATGRDQKVTNVRAGEAGALECRCYEMCRCTVQGETGREE
jgi:hypothetical protein